MGRVCADKKRRIWVAWKKKLMSGEGLEVILVDVMESRAQRPKRNRYRNKKPIKNRKNEQKRWYSSKKKYHTIKSQIVICAKTKIIIAVLIRNPYGTLFRFDSFWTVVTGTTLPCGKSQSE